MEAGERQVAIRTADICEACAAGAAVSTVPYKACAACASKVITVEQALVVAAELERDALLDVSNLIAKHEQATRDREQKFGPYPASPRAMALAVLERDVAISLLLEAINDGLADGAAVCPNPCGACWACRVDKFLRDVRARK